MENIIIIHPDGTTIPLFSRSNVSTATKAEQKASLMNEDIVSLSVQSARPIHFILGDTIEAFGKTYTLNQLPTIKKTGTRKFAYELTFEGPQYDFLDVHFLLPNDTIGDSFTGNLAGFLGIFMGNVLRVFPGKWMLGEYPEDTEYKTLTFTGENSLSVLQRLCEEYGQEFEIEKVDGVYVLHIRRAGVDFPYTFRYGKTGGLYELTRQNISSKNVVTRLFVYGSSANLGRNYRHSRLCLPGSTGKNNSYIESADAIAAFGVKENTKTFDNIRPERFGEVTGLGADCFTFVDETMNFDLNEKDEHGNTKWLIVGVNAKIHFNTGNLAGYEFEIEKYDHTTKTMRLMPFQDENGMIFPNDDSAAFQIAPGNVYFFTDINLPDQYKADAEERLDSEGLAYYEQNSQPKVQYGLNIDQNFIEQFAGNLTVVNLFAVGDYVLVEDKEVGVHKSVRIMGFTRDLLRPYKYTLTLGDSVTKSTITRVIAEQREVDRIIEINNLANPSRARRNWRASQEVLAMVFDPEGDYYSEKIKPLSVETSMLAVGAKSMQFVLRNVVFEPNYEGNPNNLRVSGGQLVHYAIEDTIRTWDIATLTYSNLVSNTPYYMYARCSKTGTDGSIILDTVQRPVDNETAYYTFMVGVLNSVEVDDDGANPARLVALTYGSSTISGRFIKTGRIESSGGGTAYFDLDNGEIGGNIKFTAADGSSKNVSDLDETTQETKDFIDNTLPDILEEIQAQLDGQIEQFFETYDPTNANAPANTWTTTAKKEEHLGDLFYNTVSGKVFRWVKQGSDYFWQELQDNEVAEALSIANDALALAQTKRRIFTATPYPPYDVGDLWVQGASGDIMRCKTVRATGSYSASDWEKASNYTNDATLTNFINGSYASTITDLATQIDGKIETWFQTSDPSTAWTTAALRAKHAGDMWYSSSTKLLKRYTGSGWTTIEDQKAIDAYSVASTAKDAADGKRRVFVATPYPPYDIGDLWVNGTDLRRCATARASGSYNANDWVIAVNYDNTVTTINGGIVTSGTVQLAGSSGSILAGITGNGTTSSSVRMWAGASYDNRATAPFRVLQDGKVIMMNADVAGVIKATGGEFTGKVVAQSGSIGGFNINGGGLTNDFNSDSAYIIFRYDPAGIFAGIGTNVFPVTAGSRGVARFENHDANGLGRNMALYVSAKNGLQNFAVYAASGDIVCNGAIADYPFTIINPSANITHILGEITMPTMFKILARFTNSNSNIGLPTRNSVALKLGIGSDTPFSVRITIICSADSTQRGHIYGRNTSISGMNSTSYPQRLNNNAGIETGGLGMEKGDIDEFQLVWDGTNYRAYHLNSRH